MPAGRPRSEAARTAVLTATREELANGGYDRLTIDRVAATAGVAKQTIYRWYRSKSALVADCLLQGYVVTPAVELKRTGTTRADVLHWMRDFASITKDPHAVALIRAASAAASEDPAIARGFQQQMKTLARDAITTRLIEGEAAGELRPGLPAATVAEVIVGSLVYRLFTHEEITPEFVDELAATVFDGITVRSTALPKGQP